MEGSTHTPGSHDRALVYASALDLRGDETTCTRTQRQRGRLRVLRLDAAESAYGLANRLAPPGGLRMEPLSPQAQPSDFLI